MGKVMNPAEQEQLNYHLNEIAAILYKNTRPEQLQNFESIEQAARQQILTEVSPKIGEFFFTPGQNSGEDGQKRSKVV
jgi:hypothetical protein